LHHWHVLQVKAANELVDEAEKELKAAGDAGRQHAAEKQALVAKLNALEKEAAALPELKQKCQDLEAQASSCPHLTFSLTSQLLIANPASGNVSVRIAKSLGPW
jgi:uncharacterized protein involved in exopolysaccharide biosynthesis